MRYKDKTYEINVWITFPFEIDTKKRYPYEKVEINNTWSLLKKLEGNNLRNELQLIEEYDRVADLSKARQKEIYNLLETWNENTCFLYSWRVDEEFAQKLLKFREEFTRLAIPSVYGDYVEKLYKKTKREVSYTQRRKLFAEIKEYTVPIPIWMKKVPVEEGFPLVDVLYDETYGVKKEIGSIII